MPELAGRAHLRPEALAGAMESAQRFEGHLETPEEMPCCLAEYHNMYVADVVGKCTLQSTNEPMFTQARKGNRARFAFHSKHVMRGVPPTSLSSLQVFTLSNTNYSLKYLPAPEQFKSPNAFHSFLNTQSPYFIMSNTSEVNLSP